MGVAGTAWATIIAVIEYCSPIGIPILHRLSTAIGSVILQTAVNGLGSTAVASVTAAGKAYDIDKGQRNVKYHVDQQHLTRLVEDDHLGCIYKEKRNLAGPQKHNS